VHPFGWVTIAASPWNLILSWAAALFDSLSQRHPARTGHRARQLRGGEQAAHDIMRAAAESMGLDVSIDAIGNLMMTLPGRDRLAPRIIIGSHLDSVPQGGNYDGAAGLGRGTMRHVFIQARRDRGCLRYHGDGYSRRRVSLVRHCVSWQRRRVRIARPCLPLDTALRQWPQS